MNIQSRVLELNLQIKALIDYMQSKITAKDWHAVQDSASDIRELEAQLIVFKELQEN